MDLNSQEKAYIAGLIDGEGSVELRKPKDSASNRGYYYSPRIRVCMTDRKPVAWLREKCGGNLYERNGTGNRSDSFTWCIKGKKKVMELIEEIEPFLKVKDKHIDVLREYNRTTGEEFYKQVNGIMKELTEEAWQKREKCYQDIRKLNQRGVS